MHIFLIGSSPFFNSTNIHQFIGILVPFTYYLSFENLYRRTWILQNLTNIYQIKVAQIIPKRTHCGLSKGLFLL